MAKFVKPFGLGDLVMWVKPGDLRGFADLHLIQEAHKMCGEVQYSTNHGAWYRHSDFALVMECNEMTWELLHDENLEDEEEMEEEDLSPRRRSMRREYYKVLQEDRMEVRRIHTEQVPPDYDPTCEGQDDPDADRW